MLSVTDVCGNCVYAVVFWGGQCVPAAVYIFVEKVFEFICIDKNGDVANGKRIVADMEQ